MEDPVTGDDELLTGGPASPVRFQRGGPPTPGTPGLTVTLDFGVRAQRQRLIDRLCVAKHARRLPEEWQRFLERG